MKKLILITLLKVSFIFTIFAQQNFQSGYVIQNSGDTLKGEIDNKFWRRNPENITFKNSNGITQTFGVNDIKAFQVDGTIYKSAIVEVETSPENLNSLEENNELHFKTDTVFLEAHYIGVKSLYSYLDNSNKTQIYIGKDNDFELLLFKKFYFIKDDSKKLTYVKKYRSQLAKYLQECENINRSVGKIEVLKLKDVKKLFDSYYKCEETLPLYKKIENKQKASFGLVVGITNNQPKINTNSNDYQEILDNSNLNSTTISFGLQLDISLKSKRQRTSFYNELYYTYYSSDIYQYTESDPYQYEYHITYKASYMKLANMLRQSIIKKSKSSLFLELGITNGYTLNTENNRMLIQTVGEQKVEQSDTIFPKTKKFEQGIVGGIGFSTSKLTLDLRYERSNGFSKMENIPSPVNRFSVIFGYSF